MLKYLIKSVSNQKCLASPYSSNKFFTKDLKEDNNSVSLLTCYVVEAERERAYYMTENGEKHDVHDVSVEIREIIDSVQPFNFKQGLCYNKYTHVLQIQCRQFKIWAYCSVKGNFKRKTFSSLNDLKRNMYFNKDGVNYRVIRVEDVNEIDMRGVRSEFKIKNFKTTKQDTTMPYLICYDCETVSLDGRLVPFIIAAKDMSGNEFFGWRKAGLSFDDEFYHGADLFVKWLIKILTSLSNFYGTNDYPHPYRICVRLFGYNNHSFDNNFIYELLRKKLKNFKFSYNSRYGKTTAMEFVKGGLTFSIVDLIKWFPATALAKACKDYGISKTKYDVDILKYCNECSKDKKIVLTTDDLKNYFKSGNLDENFLAKFRRPDGLYRVYDLVTEYCDRDVEATVELYEKLNGNMQEVFKVFNDMNIKVPSLDIFNYVSPPQLSFLVLKEMMIQDNQRVMQFNNPQQSEFIFDSYMGGRCDYSIIGECLPTPNEDGSPGEYIYADVTSEYPTAMNGYFPDVSDRKSIKIGEDIDLEWLQSVIDRAVAFRYKLFEQKILHTTCEYLRELNQFKGIFMCTITPPANKNHYSTWAPVGTRIYPQNTGKLYFLNCRQEKRVLNTAHFQALILAGWNITIEECRFNILFKKQAKLMEKYVEVIGQKKTESNDNKTLRNIYKLMLNSLYGKMAQKPKHLLHTQEGRTVYNYTITAIELTTRNDWSASYHYLSTFITGQSNWMIFQAAYYAELEMIYENKPISYRTNTVLYTDTDSLIINKNKMSKFMTFDIGEEIGLWNEDRCTFDVKWKYEEYGEPIIKLIVLSKKTYFLLGKDDKLLCLKAKGVHGHIAKNLTLDSIKAVADGKPLKLNFDGLIKKSLMLESGEFDYEQDFIKSIHDVVLKKTMTRAEVSELCEVKSTDENDLKLNHKNLSFMPYNETTNNYLKFTCSSDIDKIWMVELQRKKERLDNFFSELVFDEEENDENE